MLPDLTCVHTVHRSDTVTQMWRQTRTHRFWSCAWLYIFRVDEWRMDMWKLFTSCIGFVTLILSQHIRMREIPSRCFTPHWTTSFLWAHQTKNTTHVFIYCTFQNNVTQPPINDIFSFIWTVPYCKSVIWGHFTCRLTSCRLSCTHHCTVFATVLLFYFIFLWLHVITPLSPCSNNKWGKKIDLHVFLLSRVSSIPNERLLSIGWKKTTALVGPLVLTLLYHQLWNVSVQINSLPVKSTLRWKKGTTCDYIFNIGHILRRNAGS